MSDDLYGHEFTLADGRQASLEEHRGQVLLIVNTASKCGFTPQFSGLQALHKKYADRGLVVLGFPCNQFAKQDPGTMEEIVAFCQNNYEVDFPMAQKIKVNGKDAHPLYRSLKSAAPGLLGSPGVKWNFTKFLVDRQGQVKRFAPKVSPKQIETEIEALL